MKQFYVNQQVIVSGANSRQGTIKAISGHTATIWFDADGEDVGYYSIATLNLVQ